MKKRTEFFVPHASDCSESEQLLSLQFIFIRFIQG